MWFAIAYAAAEVAIEVEVAAGSAWALFALQEWKESGSLGRELLLRTYGLGALGAGLEFSFVLALRGPALHVLLGNIAQGR